MSVVRRLCTSILDFITALDEDTLATCTLGKAADVLPAVEGEWPSPWRMNIAEQQRTSTALSRPAAS